MSGVERDDDMERLLREAFDARARQAVPDDRRPPPIVWADAPRARRPWIAPLAVAASIAVVAGGVGLTVLHQRPVAAPPAAQVTSGSPTPGPTSATTASSTPSTTGTTAPTSPATGSGTGSATGSGTTGPTSAPPAAGRTLTFAGATVVLPPGWGATPSSFATNDQRRYEQLCIDPVASHGSSNLYGSPDCTIFLTTSGADWPIDTNIQGGYETNPSYCGASVVGQPLKEYRDVTMGGRLAEYRRWVFTCSDGKNGATIEQYQVPTVSSWVLWSEHAADPAVHTALAAIAGSVTLPAATSSTRLADHGNVTAAVPQADGSTLIQLDRVIQGMPNKSPAVYTYRVPAGLTFVLIGLPKQDIPASGLVGRTVTLHTNGKVVTDGLITAS